MISHDRTAAPFGSASGSVQEYTRNKLVGWRWSRRVRSHVHQSKPEAGDPD